MKKLIALYLIIFFQSIASAQNPAGEYMGIVNAEFPFLETVNLVLKCNNTFILTDSAIKLSGKWFVDHKSALILSYEADPPPNTTIKNNTQLLQLRFDITNNSLIWTKYSIQTYRNLKCKESSSPKIIFNKKKWRKNKLVKRLSYLPCS